jgi:hypothetical protein
MTLNQILALLPDNTTGQISAADLRSIITEIFNAAYTFTNQYSYQYTPQSGPASGKINLNSWDMSASVMAVSKTSNSGLSFPSVLVDSDPSYGTTKISNANKSSVMLVNMTGPSTDGGTYLTYPVTVLSVVGPIPATNAQLTVTVQMSVAP